MLAKALPSLPAEASPASRPSVKPVVATLLFFFSLAAAADTRFTIACEKLAAETDIRVLFEDKPLTRDDSRSVEVLAGYPLDLT